jgi:hypothetical protein
MMQFTRVCRRCATLNRSNARVCNQCGQAFDPAEIFLSYAHEDEDMMDKLRKHLSPLVRSKQATIWYDRQIQAGSVWASVINDHLRTAEIILFLVSADFLNSDYCYETEMQEALDRHERGEACVIPVIIRPVADWQNTPFGKLQAVPKNGKPVKSWSDQDAALVNVVQEIRKTIDTRYT